MPEMPQETQPLEPKVFPNLPVSEDEENEIISKCQQFKQSVRDASTTKKQAMRDCYAYINNQFVGGDLLPTPSTYGSEKDIQNNRPKVFIPVCREQLKQLYSQIKLTLFPNDEDYFRVKGKTAQAAEIEDDLTDALKDIFSRNLISEKIGKNLYNVIWAGNAAAFPTLKYEQGQEWIFDREAQEYVAITVDTEPQLDVEAWNPINFYPDINEDDPDKQRWGYYTIKKKRELLDSDFYYNKARLREIGNTTYDKSAQDNGLNLNEFNGLTTTTNDPQHNVQYDLYYFPYLETNVNEYRNMIIGIVNGTILVRFHPSTYPKGLNPGVFFDWCPSVDSSLGTGPIEDIKNLQILINIVHNHNIETMARIGNRFVATPDVDLTNLFGVAGGVAIGDKTENLVAITGDYIECQQLMNLAGVLKAEAQQMAGAQTPFQGSSDIDFKKTATEIQVNANNSISVTREVIEHITVMGVQRIMDRLMYLAADMYDEPITVRVDDPIQGKVFKQVDLSVLRSGQFSIEMVSINAAQSKQVQVNMLMQLVEMCMNRPDMLGVLKPLLIKIGTLEGLKDIEGTINDILEQIQLQQSGAMQAGMGIAPQPPMGGPPVPNAGIPVG